MLEGMFRVPDVRWAAAALAWFAVGGLAQLAGAPPWLWIGAYLACYATGGWGPAWEGLSALAKPRFEVDLLMVIAAVAAAAIGQWFDGALLIVIFATSGALEAVLTERTADSVRSLLDLAPERAVRLSGGTEEAVDAADLAAGDAVLVRPGDRVPADGTVTAGESEVDESTLTGEPMPNRKAPGSTVLAGTVNGTGALTVAVARDPSDSVLARVSRQVEEASEAKSRTQLTIEKVEQPYSLAVVAITLALIGLPLAFGAQFEPVLLRAMTFMIVASPCAIVLATMPPLLAAVALAGRRGVLVKSALMMERLAEVETAAFDKTGTLTTGAPEIERITVLDGDQARLRRLVAAAELKSEHPIGRVLAAIGPNGGAEWFEALPGRGVKAAVDGVEVQVGHPVLLEAAENSAEAAATVADLESKGMTVAVVLADDRPIGAIALTDAIRPEAAEAIGRLETILGTETRLLTGDNRVAANRVAEAVGIGDAESKLLPGDKAARLAGTRTLYCGDGVNDAPALAASHVGAAMGGTGSDLALQSADVVLVGRRLTALPAAVALARRARRVARANLCFAAAVIVALSAWDLLGHLPMVLGVAGHELSTVIVGLNGLRLLSGRHWNERRSSASDSSPVEHLEKPDPAVR
ncbi:heavy metal translocating P-type ATPase [Glycomyces sp. L485]|uniref:heavy metal translocating P-type ATPase n=1 Tax=Glycomyces sp. L485 TaxID=2909235 RepID=UPI001F4B6337|nr:heavy metal translocating P-type ATPase [Glycomyces sp. L485]MCH7230996.1 heavy metal translocating P-type ATPase [Glycomyces sp. L485]